MSATDVREAINKADSETARLHGRGRCQSCGLTVDLITTDLSPVARWLDDDGIEHGAPFSECRVETATPRTIAGEGEGR